MNIREMHSWFNILLDHFNEPYFIDTEIDEFINAGTVEFVNDIIFKEYFPSAQAQERGPQTLSSIESVIQGSEILQPLLVPDVRVTAVSGIIDRGSIATEIESTIGEPGELMHIIHVVKLLNDEERMVRYVRHNDRPRFKQNVFKAATERNPIFNFSNLGIMVEPRDDEDYLISLVKKPRKVSLETDVDSDLPSFTHQRIIAYAINMAGVASRDDVMLQLQKLSGNGTSRQD